MIVTMTLNPAVDETLFVHSVEIGAVNRVHDSHFDPAGKGINVSRLVHRLGWPTVALGFLAGDIGDLAERTLGAEGVLSHFVRVRGETRLNVTIRDEGTREETSFFDRGPLVTPDDLERLDQTLNTLVAAAQVLVLAGSLPPGLPDDTYANYIRMAEAKGIKTILDAHNEALRLGLMAHPYMVKPNRSETETLLGRKLPDREAVIDAAKDLIKNGVKVVVISMGAEGAICAEGDNVWHAIPPNVERRSSVGSGDSMVAGLAISVMRGQSPVEGLRLGTAAGAATAMTPGTTLGSPEDVASLLPQVRIERLA